MWFKNDLRVYDNPALFSAMSQGSTLAIYIITEGQWKIHGISPAKRALILRQVKSLELELEKLHVPLIVLSANTFNELPDVIGQFAISTSIKKVFFNQEYEVNEQACAQDLIKHLNKLCIPSSIHHDTCIIEPGKIRNQQGEPYKVYSAFKRAYVQAFSYHGRSILNRPEAQRPLRIDSDLNALPGDIDLHNKLWPAGEEEAHDRLNKFLDEKIKQYKAKRDIPSEPATSQLSPYLAIGAISSTQCMHAALSLNHGSLSEGNQGIATWINELIWREFYKHLLVDFPRVCRFKPFKQETDRLPWRKENELFEAWKEGRTGFPIVDAAMRQLKATAWMHNRLRMVVAMFLTKHLFIDWRLGEAYFMSQLVDGDLAANNGGWQWSASTGVDAVPYFRIFNPVRQSQRFDESGAFIRQYLPELSSLDDKSIHMPSTQQAKKLGYPLPIVDHTLAVAQTKLWFKQLSEPTASSDLFSVLEQETA
jgi:deoxyribodipyrimidine photo-lyase